MKGSKPVCPLSNEVPYRVFRSSASKERHWPASEVMMMWVHHQHCALLKKLICKIHCLRAWRAVGTTYTGPTLPTYDEVLRYLVNRG